MSEFCEKVGFLVPLNKRLEKEKSLPECPIYEGDNVIGRNIVSVTDKRLSRKHIILSASSSDGSADLFVVKFLNFLFLSSFCCFMLA